MTEATEDQAEALSRLQRWIEDPDSRVFRLGGYAGTGKTTVIRMFLDACEEDLRRKYGATTVMSLTGKAAQVLRSKGVDANTIHSTIYHARRDKGKLVFDRKPMRFSGIAVVDEASMIGARLDQDLSKSFEKILYVGDPAQLEPVGRDDVNMMKSPDFTLKNIHRQARGSDIIQFAHHLRYGGSPRDFLGVSSDELSVLELSEFDNLVRSDWQVVVGFNDTRRWVNRRVREAEMDENGDQPLEGDRIVGLRNNRREGVFNGMVVVVEKIQHRDTHEIEMDVVEEGTDTLWPGLVVAREGFYHTKPLGVAGDPGSLTFFDFAYALSCHRAQGSEWDQVLVAEEMGRSWDAGRWRYTAATRASGRLIFCCR